MVVLGESNTPVPHFSTNESCLETPALLVRSHFGGVGNVDRPS